MFYKIIEKKRDIWLASETCPVRDLLGYIIRVGWMRDVQIDAIKTYLFLKIACNNMSLSDLFISGTFNTLNFDELELRTSTKIFLQGNPAAAALYEYASFPTAEGKPFSQKLLKQIKDNPKDIDYNKFFHELFYNVSYTDYLFSLPMGAGKTYLMAAFIYLDLYFAENEPDNPAFAHNFIIFAPSGLKSSVIPSLRTIQNFDPSRLLPESAASNLKRKLIFEVLDQNKSQNKSNRTKNPNVQKIAIHQPLRDLFGFVAVTNAEKVILDRMDIDDQLQLIERTEDEADAAANELRNIIGKLPGLSIFIDEVHHAAKDDKKLRAVVNKWMTGRTVNSVIGFSGTPYLEKKEKVNVTTDLSVANLEISNIVYYYPLVDGIGNFLKKPAVKIAEGVERLQIVENGIRLFLENYKDLVYSDGTCAKLGVYCGSSIETLEEQVYPLAARIAQEFDLAPAEAVLRYHGGNRQYPRPVDSDLKFASLDKSFSNVRIVLLVQIGKEGWDCRSLTGIVLAQEGDCPTNMVLQTSCRCLRQVEKGMPESALIYLNKGNADILDVQLKQQHHISIKEFERGNNASMTDIRRCNRMEYLHLPKIDFYQLRIFYQTLVIETERNAVEELSHATVESVSAIIRTAEAADSLNVTGTEIDSSEKGNIPADYNIWLYTIVKESFGVITHNTLRQYDACLRQIFQQITYDRDGIKYFSSRYRQNEIRSNIRKVFYEKRSFKSREELIPEAASLLKLENFTSVVQTPAPADFYPEQTEVEKIVKADRGELELDASVETMIKGLENLGQQKMADDLRSQYMPFPHKDKTYHYLPYRTDSAFEQTFLKEIVTLNVIQDLNLEVYYNGDRALTEFKIRCYEKQGSAWTYIGMYTPDFLIIRRENGVIHQAIIVETKGKIYANDPAFKGKRSFMETEFIRKNNEKFGYRRFEFLYLEDNMPEDERIVKTAVAIKNFFKHDTM